MEDINFHETFVSCVERLPNNKLKLRDIAKWWIFDQKSFTEIGKLLGKHRRTIHWRFQERVVPKLFQYLAEEGWDEERILKVIWGKGKEELPILQLLQQTSRSTKYIGVTSTKIFHVRFCPYLKLLRLKKMPLLFSTQESAIENKFEPCQRCLPNKNPRIGIFKRLNINE